MRFLVDAQLPRRLVYRLREADHDAAHTLDLPEGNRTSDEAIIALSMRERRAVVTKDADFADAMVLRGVPHKLLLVGLGNVRNAELERLFVANLPLLVSALERGRFVELGQKSLRIRL